MQDDGLPQMAHFDRRIKNNGETTWMFCMMFKVKHNILTTFLSEIFCWDQVLTSYILCLQNFYRAVVGVIFIVTYLLRQLWLPIMIQAKQHNTSFHLIYTSQGSLLQNISNWYTKSSNFKLLLRRKNVGLGTLVHWSESTTMQSTEA